MKVFIFENLDKVSDNYHEEGGLTVVARDKEHAIELINAEGGIQVTEEEWKNAVVYDLKHKRGVEPKVFVFPDAGCC